ncbi:MAG: hypothetical protein FWE15_20090 [Actinomycetia bacterium]|nr:hypothetical protein [Actinomycetes bacterium]
MTVGALWRAEDGTTVEAVAYEGRPPSFRVRLPGGHVLGFARTVPELEAMGIDLAGLAEE